MPISYWHSGSPIRSARFLWPSEDATGQSGDGPEGAGARKSDLQGMSTLTSIMDGLILYWLPFSRPTRRTVIYMADTQIVKPSGRLGVEEGESKSEGEGMREEEGEIMISVVTELPYFAHCTVLLEKRTGFVTAEWVIGEKVLSLRRHALDGSLVKETSISAPAVWGKLRVFGQKVAICVSSGSSNVSGYSQTSFNLRLGYGDKGSLGYGAASSSDENLTADQIVEWDTEKGTLRRITIPNTPVHGAEFHFLNEHQIALACVHDDPQGPLLMCLTDQSKEEKSFSSGGSSEDFILIGKSIGIAGSNESSDILVHSFDRIAVFDKKVLTTDIPDNQRTGRLHFMGSLLLDYDIRVLPFALPGSLPAISGNRVLVCQRVDDEYVFYVLDFDQGRVGAFLDKTTEEREELGNELSEAGARVKIVTRRFFALEEGVQMGEECEDAEYQRSAPPEWQNHLDELAEKEEENPSLLFDEAPRERGRPFGFVQSLLRLEKVISAMDVGRMALTSSAVIFAPKPGSSDGMIWYF
ncbi:hypothetical protein D9758_008478 [Tetrapyrgos nigripes]|uniref:Uncharacterized protein n=1 Tax=Tetrapyrgos nigripes TaxID=182062 RepID=A0A8H5CP17_9AGAR|nr:hypothetical protein D9758_008478 [Tetrapyrgos nigripes]